MGNNNIKYSDLFQDDGGIDKLIVKINKLETEYKDLGATYVKQVKAMKSATASLNTVSEQDLKLIVKQEKAIDGLTAKLKKNKEATNQISKLRAKSIRLKGIEAETEQALKISIQQQTRELKNSINVAKQKEGSLKQLEAKLRTSIEKWRGLSKAERENSKEGRKLTETIKRQDIEVKKLNSTIGRSQGNVGNYASAFKGVAGAFRNLAGALGITAGLAGLARVVSNSIGIFSSYEKQNSKLQAVLGVTKDEMIGLTEASKELGATTAFTASEVAGLQTEFAKLGFPTSDILAMTESTLNAAAAMDADLGEAAKLTGGILKSFKLDATEATRVNDVLAKSTSISALDFQKLSSSMSTIAPVANKFGFSLEETTALLGQLSNSNFDASSAATATRNILLNLADSNGKLAKSLKEPVTDLPSLVKGLNQLKSEGIDLGKALQLTDKRSVAAFATFLDGTDDLLKLDNALDNAEGTAKDMADTMLDNLAGAVTKLNSAWEGLILGLEDGNGSFATTLKNIVRVITELLSLASGTEKASDQLTDYEKKVRNTANKIVFFGKVLKILVIGFVAYRAALLASIIRTKVLEFWTKRATFSFKAFNAATKANVFGLVASLLAVLVGTIVSFTGETEKATDAQNEFNKSARDAAEALKSIEDRYKILGGLSKKQLQSLKSDIEEQIGLDEKRAVTLKTRADEIEKEANAVRERNRIESEGTLKQISLIEKEIKAIRGKIPQNAAAAKFADDEIERLGKQKKELEANLQITKDLEKFDLRQLDSTLEQIKENEERVAAINKLLENINKAGDNSPTAEVSGLLEKNAEALKKAKEALGKAQDLEGIIAAQKDILDIEKERQDLLGQTAADRLKANEELIGNIETLEEDALLDRIKSEKDKELEIFNFKQNIRKSEIEDSIADEKLKQDALTLLDAEGVKTRAEIEKKFADKEKKERQEEARHVGDLVVTASLDALSEIEEAEQRKLDEKIAAVDNQISRQQELAQEGLANTLAFEEAERAKFELQKIASEKKAIRLEKVKALYAAYSSAASSGDDQAIVKVLRDFAIIQGIESSLTSFGTGTGEHGTVADTLDARTGGSKVFSGAKHNSKGGGGIPIMVEGDEGIWSRKTMSKFGKDNFMSLTSGIDNGTIGSDIFGKQMSVIPQQNVISMNFDSLKNEMADVKKAIENKPVPSLHAESISETISDLVHTVQTGNKTVKSRYRINKTRL